MHAGWWKAGLSPFRLGEGAVGSIGVHGEAGLGLVLGEHAQRFHPRLAVLGLVCDLVDKVLADTLLQGPSIHQEGYKSAEINRNDDGACRVHALPCILTLLPPSPTMMWTAPQSFSLRL